ncbi:FAD-dependent monooxygenase [Ancylobacter sp. 6x-1]|uniref:FAD-dependent monooxygenase n=1 Tax=Ancylobacter crimeensis TaxID=2579147 RepID=A0ABT0DF28_9HYPH|nr:FAD-dependent monooxygenase [Ancylobacter crimeensis]MCK0198570.1 FAD-dependent monooxygenase [Ancylobacter crimeensis]
MASNRIVIAGAGIGGLAAALAVARTGRPVTVLERAVALEEAGAGVQLAANATRCLAALGVLDRLRDAAVHPRAFRICDGISGRLLAEADTARDAEAHYGGPFLVVHRADLQRALLEKAAEIPEIELKLGRTVEDFSDPEGKPFLTVSVSHEGEREAIRCAALIGADGLRSTIRARLSPSAIPVFRKRAAWRATLPVDEVPGAFVEGGLVAPVVRLWMGPGAHMVAYPVKAGRALNLVVVTADERAAHGWGFGAAREELVALFRRWHPEPRNLLAEPDAWLRWALCDLEPLHQWGLGRVTLLGDAAHAMLPFLAQGAAQAIEDACVLGACLAVKGRDEHVALRAYEQARKARTRRVQKAALGMDRIYHLGGPARLARDFVIRNQSGASLYRRYGWIYGWTPPPLP